MLRFGIFKSAQYPKSNEARRLAASRVSYDLLDVGEDPTEDKIEIFEDLSRRLRTSNGIFRTTFADRFRDLDQIAMRWIAKSYGADTALHVQDRAASHALTSYEWAVKLLEQYPEATFEASDKMFWLVRLSINGGGTYVIEPGGELLQYIRPPFVVSLQRREPWRFLVNRAIAARARRRFQRLSLPRDWMETAAGTGYQVGRIPFVHPRALRFSRENPSFRLQVRSVFERTPDCCHVLRTMNIFNPAYFSQEQLSDGILAAFHSLKTGGIWIVGRTLEKDFSNHASFLQKQRSGWRVLERLGKGSEIESLALRVSVAETPHDIKTP
jgi:hypothetical protein